MEIKTKSGELSSYGLACGYVERYEKNNVRLTLWKEHNAYHVRKHNFNDGTRIFWDTFNTLTEAKGLYKLAKKEMGA